MRNRPASRDENEIARSADEASKIVIKPVQLKRYLNPSVNTPFPLEYAFHLLGEATGQTVLDLGCGSGEELIPLLNRGARVIGIDLSPDLIAIAERRLKEAGLVAKVTVGSAYETELPDASVDVIFCIALVHHLEISRAREEIRRILRPGGFIVLEEPIRFSKTYGFLRRLLPDREDISDDEHPLTEEEFRAFKEGFECDGLRFFRLPFVPMAQRIIPAAQGHAFRLSNSVVQRFPATARYATVAVARLRKPDSGTVYGRSPDGPEI